MSKYQICTKTIMDTTDPTIIFNEKGESDYYTNYINSIKPNWHTDEKGHAELMKVAEKIKKDGKNRDFDCIIGLSGGVDSSYLAVLAHNYGLRILAVHLDNGWNSPIAVKNINSLVSKLNIDYASYVLPWKDFKKVQLAFLQASVPEAETPTDVAIGRATNHYALQTGTKFILSGGNIASEGILPMSWHYNCRDTKYT